jgi:hypothetical protein
MSDLEESAKAAQEIAKTTGKAIDASRELGGFFSRVFGRSLEQLGGMGEDSLTYLRRVRQLRLAKRFEEIRKELGFDGPIDPVDFKLGLPLIEAASIEDDDSLQDLYARLLATATNPDSKARARRAFVSILQDFGPLEVLLLDRIYAAPSAMGTVVRTGGLRDRYAQDMDQSIAPPSPEVELALWTLARAGCIEPAGTYGGGTSIAAVTMTALGRALVEAAIRVPAQDEI